MSGPWNDFNSAQSNTNVIPKGTLAKVRLTLRPGGFDDPSQGWTGGFAKRAATGAVYLDAGFETAAALVHRLYANVALSAQMSAMGKDPKTELQEWLQARKMKLPSYRVVATLGEAHKQTFDVECTVVETGHSERGIGASRRAGEQAAAAAMLQHLVQTKPSRA